MKEYGYYVEEIVMVCPKCAANTEYVGLLTVAEEEGYPDGYTCNDCDAVIGSGASNER
jgi:hypothetical protein